MRELPTPPENAVVFDIGYDGPLSGSSNAELKGRGRLAIDPNGPVYTFTGVRRRFLSREPVTVELGAHDIANVLVSGRTIRFAARPRAPGAPVRPFVFHCRDDDQARAIAGLLPVHQLEGFAESKEFLARLDGLAGRKPVWATVTGIIIALNVAVFIVMAGFLGAGWIIPGDLTPYIVYGANNGAATTDGEWWRLLTSMFMHFGILHISLNMWALYNTGLFLEKLQGRSLFLLTYLGSGLAGGFASILWNGDKVWSAGASGAIFGVIGGIIGFMLHERQTVPPSILRGMMKSSLAFAGYNILFGFSIRGIDNSAHLGGLAGGILFGWLLSMPVDRETRSRLFPARIATGLLALAAIVAAGVKFTPRFDYRIGDELAFRDTMKEFGPRETQIADEANRMVAALKQSGDVAAFADWIERVPVPFFEGWRSRLGSLELTPGRKTAERRDKVEDILRLKINAYKDLDADLRAGRSDSFTRYSEAEGRIDALLRQLGSAR